jgi:hypothetical protein
MLRVTLTWRHNQLGHLTVQVFDEVFAVLLYYVLSCIPLATQIPLHEEFVGFQLPIVSHAADSIGCEVAVGVVCAVGGVDVEGG